MAGMWCTAHSSNKGCKQAWRLPHGQCTATTPQVATTATHPSTPQLCPLLRAPVRNLVLQGLPLRFWITMSVTCTSMNSANAYPCGEEHRSRPTGQWRGCEQAVRTQTAGGSRGQCAGRHRTQLCRRPCAAGAANPNHLPQRITWQLPVLPAMFTQVPAKLIHSCVCIHCASPTRPAGPTLELPVPRSMTRLNALSCPKGSSISLT